MAEYIEEEVARYDGRNLGAHTCRDGSGGLRVDFTYDATTPPVAMEITALVEPDVRALDAELLKLEAALREIVCSEDLGAWLLAVTQASGNLAALALLAQAAAARQTPGSTFGMLTCLWERPLEPRPSGTRGSAIASRTSANVFGGETRGPPACPAGGPLRSSVVGGLLDGYPDSPNVSGARG